MFVSIIDCLRNSQAAGLAGAECEEWNLEARLRGEAGPRPQESGKLHKKIGSTKQLKNLKTFYSLLNEVPAS